MKNFYNVNERLGHLVHILNNLMILFALLGYTK